MLPMGHGRGMIDSDLRMAGRCAGVVQVLKLEQGPPTFARLGRAVVWGPREARAAHTPSPLRLDDFL